MDATMIQRAFADAVTYGATIYAGCFAMLALYGLASALLGRRRLA